MTRDELVEIENIHKAKEKITAKDLKNKKDRTLLYGYNCDRSTWHVYLKDGKIHTVCSDCDYNPLTIEMIVNGNEGYVPDKRLYPERCDYEFCKLLAENGVELPFTVYEEDGLMRVKENGFYGLIK